MNREEVEQTIQKAGWKLDAGFLNELVIGHDSVVSILAYPWSWGGEEPAFEISHEEKETTYWVREIPTPRRAIELIEAHGGPPEEERGSPRNQAEANKGKKSS